MSGISKTVVERAQDGDAGALESLARGVQDQVHRLAMRMLADPHAAQDASQEILIRVITKLSTFAGDSKFETWVYRVAVNYLLSARKVIERDPNLSFAAFSEDLLNGLTDDHHAAPEDHVMLAELRVRCTMAMLLCLDRAHRAAYVLGEIFELDQTEAASILQVSASTYRKRLSRARKSVVDFTARTCGVANPSARCSCRKRLPAAMQTGRVGPVRSGHFNDAPGIVELRKEAEALEMNLRVAKLQRATGPLAPPHDVAAETLRRIEPLAP